MRCLSFRVQNFRSLVDSGELALGGLTAILGEHGAGKSNLLRALASLNPVGGMRAWTPWQDASLWAKAAPRIDTLWTLDAGEQQDLSKILGENIEKIRIARSIKASWQLQALQASGHKLFP